MAEGKTPGNGSTSPFGNGNGATQAAGPSSGAHNFVEDPTISEGKGGGRDFTAESYGSGELGSTYTANPDSIPAGGRILTADPTPVSKVTGGLANGGVQGVSKTPFKNMK